MRRGWAAALAAATAGVVWAGVADAAVSPARARALSAATAGLGVALSPTVPPVAPDAILTAFSDPAGDDMAGRAPDLLGTSVWSDAAGVVTVHAEIPGVPDLRPGDLYALFLDTDLDRTTGNPYAAGADAVIAIDGDTHTLGLARWTGIGWDFGVPQASLRGAWSGGPTISVDRAQLGGTASFRFWEGASARDRTGASYMDAAPETGQWAHELSLAGPATGPGVIPDRTRPARAGAAERRPARPDRAPPVHGLGRGWADPRARPGLSRHAAGRDATHGARAEHARDRVLDRLARPAPVELGRCASASAPGTRPATRARAAAPV